MDRLPDEITLRIVSFASISEWQLLELEKVSRKFKCILNDQKLWYQVFQQNYKNWGHHVSYASCKPLIDWKGFVIHLAKQKLRSRSFTFDFVPDDPLINRKRKIHELARSSMSPSPPPHRTLARYHGSTQTTMNNDNEDNKDNTEDTRATTSTTVTTTAATATTATGIPDRTSPPPLTYFPFYGPSSSTPISEPYYDRESLRHWMRHRPPTPWKIQDPLVVDIDRMTGTGIVATGKHRKINLETIDHPKRSEHKILFWEYPSWRLVRELEINFVPPEITCQIVGIQTVRIKTPPNSNGDDQPYQSIRLFALAIGQPIDLHGHIHINVDHPELEDPDGNDDRVDLWQGVLIYRLYDDGKTQCLAHLTLDGKLMGREVFFFSDYSWTFGDSDDITMDNDNIKRRNFRHWLQMVSPEHSDYNPYLTLFMLTIGPTSPNTDGCGKLVQFDLRGDPDVADPSLTSVIWNAAVWRNVPKEQRAIPLYYYSQRRQHFLQQQQQHYLQQEERYERLLQEQKRKQPLHHTEFNHTQYGQFEKYKNPPPPKPAKFIHNVSLGSHVSCMIHFRYPTHLNHLICTGSYDNNELSVYDWRFGIKVGTLPWKVEQQEENMDHPTHQPPTDQRQQQQQQPINHEESVPINNRHIPLHHHHHHHHHHHLHHLHRPLPQQQQPDHPPASPPAQTEHPDINHVQPIELTNNLTIFAEMMRENERGEFNQLAEQILQVNQDQVAMNIRDNRDDGIEDEEEEEDEEDEFETIRQEVRPWGLESAMVLPPYWDHRTPTNEELAQRGFRLIAVGDNRMNRLEIKVWDISFLLRQEWDPIQRPDDDDDDDDYNNGDNMITTYGDTMEEWQRLEEWPKLFTWWERGTHKLRLLGLRMAFERAELDEQRHAVSVVPFEIRRLLKQDEKLKQLVSHVTWPLSPPKNQQTMLLAHAFDKPTRIGSPGSAMTVKYTAYNVLCTSLFLLTEDGKVTVMDIETGQVTGTIDNVAASAVTTGRMNSTSGRVRGIDVNVVAGHEVVVTSREGLLRSVMS